MKGRKKMQYSTFTFCFILMCSLICFSFQNERVSMDDLSLVYLKWKYKHDQTKKFEDSSWIPSMEQPLEISSHNSSQVYVDCQAFILEFAKQASQFIKCSVDNSRPFRFCEGCVTHFKKAKTVYNDIQLVSIDQGRHQQNTCIFQEQWNVIVSDCK